MNAELLKTLMSWAVLFSGYEMPEELPMVVYVEHEFFVERACYGKECDVEGWYNDNDIVFLDVKFHDNLDWRPYSMVVHEFVHHLQNLSGEFGDTCEDFVKREREAYWIQRRFVSEGMGRIDTIRPKYMGCDPTRRGDGETPSES